MPLDPYVSCPCGSGKKFKWCCAPYYAQVEKAFDLERQNQHEAALAAIKELTKSHPDKPPVWGYYAQFLYNAGMHHRDEAARNKMLEQAEEALSHALKLNPNLGMAHFLRGQFRENEGEIIGALLLYRKAAEGYDPEAHDALANVYVKIYQLETMLNRPVAAHAALERAVHFQPAEAELRAHLDAEFGEESPLPLVVRKKYVFRPTAKPLSPELATGRLSDARKAFEQLTQLTPGDPGAWFNLGLVLAWLGEQPKAVEALLTSIELETDDHRAEEAGALAEVLRCGQGMQEESDHVSHSFIMPIRDPQAVMGFLRAWDQAKKLRNIRANQETGVMMGLIVEELQSLLAVGGTTLAKVTAKMVIAAGAIRISHPNRESAARVADEMRTTLQLAVEQPVESSGPLSFGDVALEALAQPVQTTDLTAAENKLRDYARNFFENVWLHRPLRALSGNTPLDAVGSKLLRKQLFGVVKFMEDCLMAVQPHKQIGEQLITIDTYSFDNLRHKLGLEYVSAPPPHVDVPPEPKPEPVAQPAPEAAPTATPTTSASPAAPARREIGAMNAGELAALDAATMSVEELEQAMRAAIKLDARELAVAFAQAGVLKPFDPSRPDRYPLYAAAITGASAAGELHRAVELAEQGEKYDAEHNGGARAMEFGMKKAQLFVKMKDTDRAVAAFDAIIARHPEEGKFYTAAAEDMLRLKNGAKALYFAERGLAKAREANNRDLAGHCEELVAAARKAM
jgi:tetratricopeptide (TPR) repeat protein